MSQSLYITDPTPEGTASLSECQNCGEIFTTDKLDPIPDFDQRTEAGQPIPSSECPECGALCYLTTSVFPSEVEKVLENLLEWAVHMGGFENRVWEQATDLLEKISGKRIEV